MRFVTGFNDTEQGRIQGLVWAHRCYGNAGFVYTNDTLWYLNRLELQTREYIRSLIQPFRVFYLNQMSKNVLTYLR